MPRVTRSHASTTDPSAVNLGPGPPGPRRGLKHATKAAQGLALRAQVGGPGLASTSWAASAAYGRKFTLDSQKRKRGLDENEAPAWGKAEKPNSKRRAALGEITNAFNETTAQAKKGLSKILNRSKTKLASSNSSAHAQSSLSANLPALRHSQSVPDESAPLQDEAQIFTESFESTQPSRLPSSQDQFKDRDFATPTGELDDSDDLYESANEGADDTEDKKNHSIHRVVPAGVKDFDAQNKDDPTQASEYAMQTFQYYKNREAEFRIDDYLKRVQKEISQGMRAILVDWLVEVQESFELNHETLYTAVKLMDMYLSKKSVPKERLQLIGAVACLIACKIDERIPPMLEDFVYVCDDAYTKDEITAKEIEMFVEVGFDVGFPLSYRFLRRYGRVCGVTMPVLTFSRYILELSLMEYHFNVDTSESQLGMAALILALRIHSVEGWEATLEYYAGYKLQEVTSLVGKLHQMLLSSSNSSRKTIRTKYSHEVFHHVALIRIPEAITLNIVYEPAQDV